jgi:hypothetical protein
LDWGGEAWQGKKTLAFINYGRKMFCNIGPIALFFYSARLKHIIESNLSPSNSGSCEKMNFGAENFGQTTFVLMAFVH